MKIEHHHVQEVRHTMRQQGKIKLAWRLVPEEESLPFIYWQWDGHLKNGKEIEVSGRIPVVGVINFSQVGRLIGMIVRKSLLQYEEAPANAQSN